MSDKSEFCRQLESLLNSQIMGNESNTPDFILAEFLTATLNAFETLSRGIESDTPNFILSDYLTAALDAFAAFEAAIKARDQWYGIAPEPGKDPCTD